MAALFHLFDKTLTSASGLMQRADFDSASLASGDPRQWGHFYVERRDLGFVAGIWQNAIFESRPLRFTGNEFFIVVAGSVVIEEPDGTEVTLARGDCAVIPDGLEHRWIQREPARLFFAKHQERDAAAAAAPRQIVRIDPSLSLPPSTPPAREMLLSDEVPSTTEQTIFRSRDGRMTVGLWTATPYHRRRIPYPRFELMHVLEGGTTFPEPSGSRNAINVDDVAIVSAGFEAEWLNEVPIRKIACNLFEQS